jgi:hypothetical protein
LIVAIVRPIRVAYLPYHPIANPYQRLFAGSLESAGCRVLHCNGVQRRDPGRSGYAPQGLVGRAHDRVRVKPLIYDHHAGNLVFGSEIEVLQVDGVRLEFTQEHLEKYSVIKPVPDNETLVRGARRPLPTAIPMWRVDVATAPLALPPGSNSVIIRAQGSVLEACMSETCSTRTQAEQVRRATLHGSCPRGGHRASVVNVLCGLWVHARGRGARV